jgi:hypothetical protein
MQYLIKTPFAENQEEKKWGMVVTGHDKVMSAIERHQAMLHQNHMA